MHKSLAIMGHMGFNENQQFPKKKILATSMGCQ